METVLLRPGQVAVILGLGRSTTYQLMAAGVLPTVRIGRAVRVPKDALERWIAARTQQPDGGAP
jgi:excisionase family DNA binding protein